MAQSKTASGKRSKNRNRAKGANRAQSTNRTPASGRTQGHAPFALLRAAVIEQLGFAERLQRMGLEMFGPSWGEGLPATASTGQRSTTSRTSQRAQASTRQAAAQMAAANAPPVITVSEGGEQPQATTPTVIVVHEGGGEQPQATATRRSRKSQAATATA